MYRTCIFCSADLGGNEAVEEFPVGKALAFDAWKGRLWAVCPRCTRWNLAPIEERWEAVESAEKQFTDARLRVQSENIGLAKLRDGTRLIRVGQALPGELAAWRYGDQLVRRRRRFLVGAGLAIVAGVAVAGGGWAVLGTGVGAQIVFNVGSPIWQTLHNRRVFYRVPAARSPTGTELKLRRWHLNDAYLAPAMVNGNFELHLPSARSGTPNLHWQGRSTDYRNPVVLQGETARNVLGRGMVRVNARGASERDLEHALYLISNASSAERYLGSIAERRATLGKSLNKPLKYTTLDKRETLALEMALHEESERRALEGELAALEAAWREAEEIAHIADYLPDEPPEA